MTNMVEKVAEALWNHEEKPQAGGLGWDLAGHLTQEAYRVLARAAILAMREPTFRMRIAGVEALGVSTASTPGQRAGEAFTAMIDAALSPPQSGDAE